MARLCPCFKGVNRGSVAALWSQRGRVLYTNPQALSTMATNTNKQVELVEPNERSDERQCAFSCLPCFRVDTTTQAIDLLSRTNQAQNGTDDRVRSTQVGELRRPIGSRPIYPPPHTHGQVVVTGLVFGRAVFPSLLGIARRPRRYFARD